MFARHNQVKPRTPINSDLFRHNRIATKKRDYGGFEFEKEHLDLISKMRRAGKLKKDIAEALAEKTGFTAKYMWQKMGAAK